MEEIGSRLKKMIDNMGLNASEFSEQVGIQRSSLSHLFSGRNKPSIDFIIKIKNAFPSTDLEWLITGKEAQAGSGMQENEHKNSGSATESIVTNVNNDALATDNKHINDELNDSTQTGRDEKEIDSIVWFYRDGSYRVYKHNANSLDS